MDCKVRKQAHYALLELCVFLLTLVFLLLESESEVKLDVLLRSCLRLLGGPNLTFGFISGTTLRQSRYMASTDFSPRICLTVAGFIYC